MKLTSVLAVVLIAVGLQTALSQFTIGGRLTFDLVLVGVIYAALQWGAVGGMLAGTVGGLAQDALSGGVVGVGGLAKTLVGFAAGGVGTQFVVAKPHARAAILAAATLVHRLIVLGLLAMIDQRWPGVDWTAMLGEVAVNAICGYAAFQFTDAMPGVVARGRARSRSGLSRRQW